MKADKVESRYEGKTMRLRLIGALIVLLAAPQAALAQTSFNAWLETFRAEAKAAGVSDQVLDETLAGLSPNERVFELNSNQPEFSRALWDYLDGAVSDTRIKNGLENIKEHGELLAQIEAAYGVDAETIVAIWGLESSFGAILGDFDVIQSLATLGFEGRRTAFGRSQFIGAMIFIQNGFASRDDLKGSWAGAMGHTQFIPTTYLAYAVDHNGDGRRDIWRDLGDVFASTANYLSVSGYRANEPWGVEVRLPQDFDYTLADASIRKAVVEWAALDITTVRAGGLLAGLDPNARARLIVPAGANGPAFLTFNNFDAILKYNRSTAYALAVALLGENVAGRNGAVVTAWPRDDRSLSLTERKSLQQSLINKGYNPGPVDGIIGAGTRKALRAWQRDNGLPADGYASAAILERLAS